MSAFTMFEILAETLVPVIGLPPQVPNPLLIQGYFVQVTLQPNQPAQAFSIIFNETTDFQQGGDQGALFAQVIDAKGNANIYANFIGSNVNGFLDQQINPGETLIFGVQALPGLKSEQALPQNGIGWRGSVQINVQTPGTLFATATHRQVFLQGPTIESAAINGAAYALPTFSGNASV